MVVALRLVLALLLSRFKPRIAPLDAASVTMRVWPNDLDFNMHANSGRYVSFMDIGRVALLVRMRILRKVIARKWRPLVAEATITYRKSLLPFERFTVTSRIVRWDEKWFYFEHVITNAKGEVSAVGNVRGLLRGPNGNVPPADVVALGSHL
ncbi:MAG TPA: acyl-CoA thioesterase [Thermoanaerobaculia bacterium]|nr:acyl-CoA thioesterase [Thermoanaerobaculia bacterium]